MTQKAKFAGQIRVPATYMRGGTSKGVFFSLTDLPSAAQVAGAARDELLLRVIGSPDPYGKQTDGMGGATSSTSKTVIVAASNRADHDVDYLFGQVAIDKAFVDWSGNCGNLSAAVGAFAVHAGLIDADKMIDNGILSVRIWQANINKTIIAHVPITDGQVQETGDFELDGVTFAAAEIGVDFNNPAAMPAAGEMSKLFPTGQVVDTLELPEAVFKGGLLKATMIDAGIPTIFVNAEDIGYRGDELQDDINNDSQALAMFETLRAIGAVKMGLIKDISEAAGRQHTPKIAFVAPASTYQASSGKKVKADTIDFNVRALSMGKLHHAMMGTAAVAIGTAAAVPGTLVNLAASANAEQQQSPVAIDSINFGHPSGSLKVGAKTSLTERGWVVTQASMSRSARILMEGWVRVPFSH
ncbi:2-methylaconitate cis-trans isomerase PrpF [Shewanella sp. Scap07]|uniref:2-methylaconitate cis-trans isomerase PrpF n=1 Tax=Shewanella sp. Scap07 TaxID=2589987 RepID=UPI0015BE52E5|nr:2-methylaconitate cis-trans isomerase PrpF [Shewanella sp. Scap07]QLE85851.1 2-methylaconitate cis-trans isomerase PrpF [Shewanella sp. Scap07]